MLTARGVLLSALLVLASCGPPSSRPGTTTPSGGGPAGADPTLIYDCLEACHHLEECNVAMPDSCESDCKSATADDSARSRWACWSSSRTCDEIADCDTKAE